jgi:hypothetical protein
MDDLGRRHPERVIASSVERRAKLVARLARLDEQAGD